MSLLNHQQSGLWQAVVAVVELPEGLHPAPSAEARLALHGAVQLLVPDSAGDAVVQLATNLAGENSFLNK